MTLWYPETREEVAFVEQVYPVQSGNPRHVGFRKISEKDGVTGFDYITFPGVPFVTTKPGEHVQMTSAIFWRFLTPPHIH